MLLIITLLLLLRGGIIWQKIGNPTPHISLQNMNSNRKLCWDIPYTKINRRQNLSPLKLRRNKYNDNAIIWRFTSCVTPWQTENKAEMEHISVDVKHYPFPSSLVTQALCYVVFKPFCDVVLLLLPSIHFPQKNSARRSESRWCLIVLESSTFAECLITLFCWGLACQRLVPSW